MSTVGAAARDAGRVASRAAQWVWARTLARPWSEFADFVHGLWMRIADPRVQRVAFFIAYLAVAQSGVNALIRPPSSIEGELGTVLTLIWALFLTFGGVVGAGTVLQGWNYLERLGVGALIVGAVMYGGIVLSLHFIQDGQRLTQWGFVTFCAVILIWRLWDIRGYAIAPRG